MQAVADGEVLDVAKLRVELGDGGAGRVVAREAAVGGKARAPGAFEDLRFDERHAPAIDTIGLGVLLQQPFKLGQRPVQAGGAERRRQMADGDGTDAPLGLHGFAGVVDDKRIDHRHRAEHRLGKALLR